MAGIGNTYFDLIDLAKSKDPDGSIADVIEMLTELHTIRTGLPSVAWGKLYKGIVQGKSTKAQVDDTTGFVEGLSTIDCRVLDLSANKAAVRMSEAQAYLEAIAQEVQETMIYGNSNSSPSEFMGLAPRFNSLSASNGNQIIDGGGTGSDNTSIWFVTWGDNACQTLYPKGTQAGVKREDMGKQRVQDGNNAPYYVEEEMFTQHIGLAVKDWRYVSRIANIDLSDMQAGTVDLYGLMRKAYYALQSRRVPHGRQAIYCNTDVLEALDGLASNAGASDNFIRLRPMEIQGKEVMTYRGIPIRETDAIHNAEAQVV
jgi:hypothetical protein